MYQRSKTQKKVAHVLQAAYSGPPRTAHYRSRHKFVGSTIRHAFFLSRLLVSKPHTKSSSTLDYMTDIVQRLT